MDNVDRMYRHLVRTIRARFPQYLAQPFDVAELHQTILPYRHHRRELGLETNEDYEITLTELLAGSRDYLIVDDAMRERLRAELAAANPDPSAFRQFAGSTVALSPNALRSLEAGPDDTSTPLRTMVVPTVESVRTPQASATAPMRAARAPESAPSPTSAGSAASPASSGSPASPASPASAASAAPAPGVPRGATVSPAGGRALTPRPGERCRACDEVLPPGRPITFCPHCGQNVTTLNCPACGSELEVGWKFCAVCGRPADAH